MSGRQMAEHSENASSCVQACGLRDLSVRQIVSQALDVIPAPGYTARWISTDHDSLSLGRRLATAPLRASATHR